MNEGALGGRSASASPDRGRVPRLGGEVLGNPYGCHPDVYWRHQNPAINSAHNDTAGKSGPVALRSETAPSRRSNLIFIALIVELTIYCSPT